MSLFDLLSEPVPPPKPEAVIVEGFGSYTEGDKPAPKEIFVFGSNLAGRHGKGAAQDALMRYGATYGVPIGLQGRSYAIPTKDRYFNILSLPDIQRRVSIFVEFSRDNPQLKFFITRVGCGLAGYKDHEIAPMFKGIKKNCRVHVDWYTIIQKGV
jgi:hypothetical protein